MESRVSCEIEAGVAYVRLAREEKHNAIDFKMFQAIIAVQKQLRRQRGVRGVILSGNGVDFCSGLDTRSVFSKPTLAMRLLWKWWPGQANMAQKVCTGWRDLPVPVIAVLHGRIWGGGLQIALGADFRIATPDADLSVMEARWGLIPDMGGNLALREQLRQDQAMWLAMTAEQIDGRKAHELGLVTELSEEPMELAQTWMAQLVSRSPDAVAATKRLFRRHGVPRPGAMLAAETLSQCRIIVGRNRKIATSKALGNDREYGPRGRW
ncbi:crotonase/enoyl-CoA hydratase family protein [Ferrimonas pelagia]|uniref:Crotonase/enoyl-CoA hydratase family protein n=1 Tax=Ferrimonas pelagia TaxID=1177826 RepID=A0ABP9FEC2_9GAMM